MKFGKLSPKKLLVLGASSVCILIFLAFAWASKRTLSFEAVQKRYSPSDVWVFDSKGLPLESLRASAHSRSLAWVSLDKVSPSFTELLVRSEDKRFYDHHGVDLLALARAAWGWARSSQLGGGSTISMQLTGLLDQNKTPGRRSPLEKAKQILLALKLERGWSKNQILEAYVNLLHFRGELVGLASASMGYFSKNPSGLNLEESALLVALIRSPNAEVNLVAKRACQAIGQNDCGPLKDLALRTFSKTYEIPHDKKLIPVLSPYFIESREPSGSLRTSLDLDIQSFSVAELQEQLRSLKSHDVHDGAVLVLDNKTAKPIAYVANGGADFSSAEHVDGIQSLRQAGSTLKPFVMATALDLNILKPNSLLEDSPLDISVGGGKIYHPRNYDQIFRGMVSVSEALGSSLNVPSVKALQLVGVDRVLENMTALGFRNLEDSEFYGPSLALGSVDVRLWDLAQAYRNFAVDSKIFKSETKKEIFNILASAEYRRFTFGNSSLLTLPLAAAVKTGTSKDMRDNWCLGFTKDYTVGVWVGNFNGHPMRNVSGLVGAAPVWRALMKKLHPSPKAVLTQFHEKAIPLERQSITRIQYPANDTLIGIDPDIPAASQMLPIEIENPQKKDWLVVNGKRWAEASARSYFPLKRGHYKVQLRGPTDEAIDEVRFEIR